jgi:hypothetical protein
VTLFPEWELLEIDAVRHGRRVLLASYWVNKGWRLDLTNVTDQIVGPYRLTFRSRPRGRIRERIVVPNP